MALADESFGDYWLSVVEELQKRHGWDDPVTHMGEDAVLMDIVYMGFICQQAVVATARMVSQQSKPARKTMKEA